MDDQDKKIILVTLLCRIWPRSPFMAKLANKNPFTLREFKDRANDFINAADTLQAIVDSRKGKPWPPSQVKL